LSVVYEKWVEGNPTTAYTHSPKAINAEVNRVRHTNPLTPPLLLFSAPPLKLLGFAVIVAAVVDAVPVLVPLVLAVAYPEEEA
jgi:hypothetical protein